MEHILPASRLSESARHKLSHAAFTNESLKELAPEVRAVIHEQQWLRVLIPASLGGLEWPLPKVVQLFEDLARTEANAGWCVNLGAGANMFAGYLQEATARTIFQPLSTWCAGSGAISGKAIQTKDGYLLSGTWKYASGANHATHFTANAFIEQENGMPVLAQGEPVFRSFIFPASRVTNHRNWDAIGLQATSSNDFSVTDLALPENASFSLTQPSAHASGPLYQFPFVQLAVVNMACMATGITLHFCELYMDLAQHKQPLHGQRLLVNDDIASGIFNDHLQQFLQARKHMYATLENCWKYYENGMIAPPDLLHSLTKQARTAASRGLTLIKEVFPLCGMNILSPQSTLNKVWRDAMTAGQHYLLSPLNESA